MEQTAVKPRFEPGVIYNRRWEHSYGGMSWDRRDRRDARPLGLIIDRRIAADFCNLKVSPGACTGFDIIEVMPGEIDRLWEVKTSREKKINIEASKHKGKGRTRDYAAHEARLLQLAGILFVDTSNAPDVRFRAVLTKDLPATRDGKLPFDIDVWRVFVPRLF